MEKLLEQLRQLQQRAAAKLAEIKDDTTPEAARAIEADHAKIMQDIAAKHAEIAEAQRSVQGSDPAPQPANAANRAAEIVGIAALARAQGVELSTEDEQEAIRTNVEPSSFRARMFDLLAETSRQIQTSPARVMRDERETQRAAMTEALSYAFGAPVPDAGPSVAARSFMGERSGEGASLIGIAAECVGWRGGMIRNARQIDDIYTRAAAMHTTSDFPVIFESSINRALEARYATAEPTYRRIARKQNFRDFRPHTTVKQGDFPMLLKVLEGGEIKYGTFVEGKEAVQAFSYARAISISRQMLINDDLGSIARLLSDYGTTVALMEEVVFYTQAFNAVLSDNKTVFHADHGNLAAPGTAIDVVNVGKARTAMAKQKAFGSDNVLLSNKAKILLVGPDKLTEAEMLIASITPATVANVNIFSGKLDVLDSGQIAGNSWHTFADPNLGSNYRWGYLDGYEAPRVRTDEPFGVQGFAMSVEHDFGVGATDYRFGYKNPGA